MAKAKSYTEAAMRNKREAYIERRAKPVPIMAKHFEDAAEALLALPTAPDVGYGGEVVRTHSAPAGAEPVRHNTIPRLNIRDTLSQGADRIAEDASIRRADLLMGSAMDCVALGIDTAASIEAANGIEKMLAHQMAAAHEAAMRFTNTALLLEQKAERNPACTVEAARCANVAARLMSTFQIAALTLHKLRNGGNQTVTVEHVTVQAGAQAVIGNVDTGGKAPRGNNGK